MEIQQLDKYFNVIHKCLSNEDFFKEFVILIFLDQILLGLKININ